MERRGKNQNFIKLGWILWFISIAIVYKSGILYIYIYDKFSYAYYLSLYSHCSRSLWYFLYFFLFDFLKYVSLIHVNIVTYFCLIKGRKICTKCLLPGFSYWNCMFDFRLAVYIGVLICNVQTVTIKLMYVMVVWWIIDA